jgi:hypothetical protein
MSGTSRFCRDLCPEVFPLLAKTQLKEEQLSSLCLSVTQIGRLITQNPQ